jgi:hypothetical protein
MNTRASLSELFRAEGLSEEAFKYLGDCRTSARFRILQIVELTIWKLLSMVGVRYPEACILGVYRSA